VGAIPQTALALTVEGQQDGAIDTDLLTQVQAANLGKAQVVKVAGSGRCPHSGRTAFSRAEPEQQPGII
jgi:hypothetical protein